MRNGATILSRLSGRAILLAGTLLAFGPSFPSDLAAVAAQQADFLFSRPALTLGARVGYAVPRAGSEIFDFTRDQLTIDDSDFNGISFEGDLGVRLTNRLDLALNVGYETSETRSEFRDFVDTDDFPIEQDTRFSRVPVTLGARFYLTERGRRISDFAWIPRRISPYVGAGGGLVHYTFRQVGDFVDFETLDIFFDRFESEGTSPLAYAAAGLEVSIHKRWLVTGEARYGWASADMDGDFVGFDDIDLAGFRAALGVAIRL